MIKFIKNNWIKYVKLWNQTVIQLVLIMIWFLVLTPTALLKRGFQRIFISKQKPRKSFLKKSTPLNSDHFLMPF